MQESQVWSAVLEALDSLDYLAPGVTRDLQALWDGLVSRAHLDNKDNLDLPDQQVTNHHWGLRLTTAETSSFYLL